jgi:hypothetical protein
VNLADAGRAVLAARSIAEADQTDRVPPTMAIYRAVYAGGWRGDGPRPDADAPEALIDSRFVAAILDADPTEEFGPLWTVEAVRRDRVNLIAAGLRASAQRGELDREPTPGATVRVASRALGAGRLPGFVHRCGTIPESPLSRVYVHLQPAAAGWFATDFAQTLAAREVGYELKVLAHPGAYFRGDSAVLMVSSRELEGTVAHIVASVSRNRIAAAPAQPLLTRRVAVGIAVADQPDDLDPSGETSHGMWVNDLLRWAAARLEEPTVERGAALVAERLAELGRDPAAPWRRRAYSTAANRAAPFCP